MSESRLTSDERPPAERLPPASAAEPLAPQMEPVRTIERTPPETRAATWLAAVVLLIAVFAVGVAVGQSGALGRLPSASSPGTGHVASPPGSPGQPGSPAPTGVRVTAPPGVPTSPPADAPGNFGLFWEALEKIRQNFVGRDQLNDSDLTYGAIRGLVDALGDTGHSTFLTPEALASEERSLDGRVVGVGALLGERNGKPVIVSVISGGPASRAGLRSGDEIVAVDGNNVTDLEPEDVASRIRGDAGTTVVVRISRPSTGETLDFSMVREEITFPAASWAFIPGTRIADLRLIQFSDGATDQLRAARDDAIAQGAQGFVLDLRSNPGGFVHEAVRTASLFIGGRTVYIRELASGERIAVGSCFPTDNPGRTDSCRTEDSTPPTDLPLVVLIDQGTASSAEIVSGAIRSAGRAELVGATTFGTGTVLLTYRLADGSAVRIAVERWLTPDGELIFERGIVPTVELPMPDDGRALEPQEVAALSADQIATMEDTQLRRAIEILRAAGVP